MKKHLTDNQQNSITSEKKSAFYRYIRIILSVHTSAGINFIDGIMSQSLGNLKVKRCSFKSIYGMMTLIIVLGVGLPMLLIDKSNRFGDVSTIAFYANVAVMEMAAVTSRIVMFWKAKILLNVIRMCCDYEASEPLTRKQERVLFLVMISAVLIHVGIVVNCATVSFSRMNELSSSFQEWINIESVIIPPIFSFIYFFQYTLVLFSYTATPYWIIYLCIFFGVCYKNLSNKIKELHHCSTQEQEVKEVKLEIIRSRYSNLCNMVNLTSESLSPEILRLYTNYGLMCCIAAYYMVNKEVEIAIKLNYTGYFAAMFMMMLIPAFITTLMANQAYSLFDELAELFFQLPPRGRQQVSTFMLLCESQRPGVTAWDFFKVDLDLIVSICATIITYTVILVQSM